VSRAPALRVASYNIHGAVGTDGRRDVERIAAVIGEIDPHIIALQEVESRRARGGIDQAERLASMLGMSCAEGPILEDGHGWYGNAILSKQPGSDVRHWRYPRHSGEPRAALGVRIADRSGQPWRVVATHLDLRFRARWHQVATLVEALADGGSEPLVLLADLNEWWPWAPSWRILSKLGEVPAGVRSFPSWCPILPLDRVVLRHCRMVKTPDTHVTALSRRASDHLPVVAEIRHGGEGSMTDRAADP
jgi:endonuclease/exonuclease/phosphatase family metal-dependent hydrolase